MLTRFGVPDKFVSDNGSQYSNTCKPFDSTTSPSNLPKIGVFVKQQALQSPSNQMVQQRDQCIYSRQQSAFWRRLQPTRKTLLKGCWSTAPFEEIGVSPTQLLMSLCMYTMIPNHQSYYHRQLILIELWKHANCVSPFLRRIRTKRVEICLNLKLGTRCRFGQIEIGNGVK